MNRLLLGLLISVFLLNLVFAASSAKLDARVTITGGAIVNDVNVNVDVGLQERMQNGSYQVVELVSPEGSGANIRAKFIIEESLINNQQIQQNMQVRLSNGRNVQIKILPETVAERGVRELGLIFCNESNDCTIELREIGELDEIGLSYKFSAKKQAKIIGLFNIEMPVGVEINAERGNIVGVIKPWWSFLTTGN